MGHCGSKETKSKTEEDVTNIIPDPAESERLGREHEARQAAWKRGELRRTVESLSRDIRRAMNDGKQSMSRVEKRDDATVQALDIVISSMKQRGYSQARLNEVQSSGISSAYTRWELRWDKVEEDSKLYTEREKPPPYRDCAL